MTLERRSLLPISACRPQKGQTCDDLCVRPQRFERLEPWKPEILNKNHAKPSQKGAGKFAENSGTAPQDHSSIPDSSPGTMLGSGLIVNAGWPNEGAGSLSGFLYLEWCDLALRDLALRGGSPRWGGRKGGGIEFLRVKPPNPRPGNPHPLPNPSPSGGSALYRRNIDDQPRAAPWRPPKSEKPTLAEPHPPIRTAPHNRGSVSAKKF